MTTPIDRHRLAQSPAFYAYLVSPDPEQRALAEGFLEFLDSYRAQLPRGLISDTRPKFMARPELAPGYEYVAVLLEASRRGGQEGYDPRQIPAKIAKALARRDSTAADIAGAAVMAPPNLSPSTGPGEEGIPRRQPIGDRPSEKLSEPSAKPQGRPAPKIPVGVKEVGPLTIVANFLAGLFGMGASTYGALTLSDPRFIRSINDNSPQAPVTLPPFWVYVPVEKQRPSALDEWTRLALEEYFSLTGIKSLSSEAEAQLFRDYLRAYLKRSGLKEFLIPDEPISKSAHRTQIVASIKSDSGPGDKSSDTSGPAKIQQHLKSMPARLSATGFLKELHILSGMRINCAISGDIANMVDIDTTITHLIEAMKPSAQNAQILRKALGGESDHIRLNAYFSIWSRLPAQAARKELDHLRDMLWSPLPDIRASAEYVYVDIGNRLTVDINLLKREVKILSRNLDDSDPTVRDYAMRAFLAFSGNETLRQLYVQIIERHLGSMDVYARYQILSDFDFTVLKSEETLRERLIAGRNIDHDAAALREIFNNPKDNRRRRQYALTGYESLLGQMSRQEALKGYQDIGRILSVGDDDNDAGADDILIAKAILIELEEHYQIRETPITDISDIREGAIEEEAMDNLRRNWNSLESQVINEFLNAGLPVRGGAQGHSDSKAGLYPSIIMRALGDNRFTGDFHKQTIHKQRQGFAFLRRLLMRFPNLKPNLQLLIRRLELPPPNARR